jgi:diguanylate cyclase (GGDEF)-like protein
VYLRPGWQNDLLSIHLGNAVRLTTFCLFWQGARVFERRRPLPWTIVAAPLAWIALCLVPAFGENLGARVAGFSALAALFCCLAAYELWRGRGEHLASRNAAIGVFLAFAALMLMRILAVDLLPFPMGARPLDPIWVGAFSLTVFVLVAFLAFLSIALTKERRELAQRNFSMLDPLTGLRNRRAFMNESAHLAGPRGERRQSALLVLDLDHFKTVNDRYGHSVGDLLLARFARIAEASTRPPDRLYRMGGEEFCFVLPNTNLAEATAIAERIRSAFADDGVVVGSAVVSATVSIGVAATGDEGVDVEVLLAAADAAVYAAKANGRDNVVAAGLGTPMARLSSPTPEQLRSA